MKSTRAAESHHIRYALRTAAPVIAYTAYSFSNTHNILTMLNSVQTFLGHIHKEPRYTELSGAYGCAPISRKTI